MAPFPSVKFFYGLHLAGDIGRASWAPFSILYFYFRYLGGVYREELELG